MNELNAELLRLVNRLDEAKRQNLEPFPVAQSPRTWTVQDGEKVQSHYRDLVQKFPFDLSQSSDISEPDYQRQFYRDLIKIGDMDHQSVLELGSGSGFLLTIFEEGGITPSRYVGFDSCSDLLTKAKTLHPRAEFVEADCFDALSLGKRIRPKEFDYVLMSGIFGVKPKDWTAPQFNGLVLEVLKNALKFARKGLAFNFIPTVYSPVRKALDWKTGNQWVSYHRMDRLQLVDMLEKRGLEIKTLPTTLERALVQYPVFLFSRGEATK